MIDQGRDLPKEVIACWPEVFGEVKLNVLPLKYLHAVIINFKDGKTWEVKVTTKAKKNGWDSFEKTLTELFRTYDKRIENIDFKLDTERVKKDIEFGTHKFLKKSKL